MHLCISVDKGWRYEEDRAFSPQYIGKWYEIQKLPTTFQKGQCGTATYTPTSPGVIGVLNRELL